MAYILQIKRKLTGHFMDNSVLKIFVGYDPKEAVVFHTCVQSIIENTKTPVSITPLHLGMFNCYNEKHNDGSNAFIYSRFLVPYLSNFFGKSLFIDGDMIVNTDVSKLFHLFNKKFALQVVKHDYKTKYPIKYLGNKNEDYPKKNWSSVILFNCEHEKNRLLTPKYIERSTGSYLHRFRWLNENDVGEIPKGWNHLVLEYEEKPKANILHYTVGSPCFEEFNQGIEADIWYKTYYRAMNGFNNTKNKTQIKV